VHPYAGICVVVGQIFQAYDEGSIPFTRSKVFNHLAPRGSEVDTFSSC